MLQDGQGRVVTYLRISVTERCNFRCQYCMPEKPFSWQPNERLLDLDRLFEFVAKMIDQGITKIRITGGEPLLREGIDSFIAKIAAYSPSVDIALTTNGFLLKNSAKRLKEAGLKRINVSLDSLTHQIAQKIAQKDILNEVLEGLEIAQEVGLGVKLNMVPLQGINDHEIVPILEFAQSKGIQIRFIEYMENRHAVEALKGMHGKEILNRVKERYTIRALGRKGASPAFEYHIEELDYTFGLIDPHKHDFCQDCNRIRMSAEGDLIPCLYFEDAKSIANEIKQGDIEGAMGVLEEVLLNKPKENKWLDELSTEISSRAFYETGG